MFSIEIEMHISAYFHCNGAFGGIFDGIFFQVGLSYNIANTVCFILYFSNNESHFGVAYFLFKTGTMCPEFV
jgi:hypothetical protein